MFQAMLIKWALDSVIDLATEALSNKVKDSSSKVDDRIAGVIVEEKEHIKADILKLIKRKRM
jgi:hypothetical protein